MQLDGLAVLTKENTVKRHERREKNKSKKVEKFVQAINPVEWRKELQALIDAGHTDITIGYCHGSDYTVPPMIG